MAEQFDPVAAAALTAIDAADRVMRQAQSQFNVPELPGRRGTMSTVRQAIQNVSQFSPPNVLARGQGPGPKPPGDLPALPQPPEGLPDLPGIGPGDDLPGDLPSLPFLPFGGASNEAFGADASQEPRDVGSALGGSSASAGQSTSRTTGPGTGESAFD